MNIKQEIKDLASSQVSLRSRKPRDGRWQSQRADLRSRLRRLFLLLAFERGVLYTRLERKTNTPLPYEFRTDPRLIAWVKAEQTQCVSL